MSLVDGSSTTSKVLVRNGGGPTSCNPSIGCGEKLEDEDDDDDEPPPHVTASSSFTLILSMYINTTRLRKLEIEFSLV